MKDLNFGTISADINAVGSQGNAILGIRGSGKSHTGTYMGERFMDAGIPIVAFDPIGIWRFLRVPAREGCKGYKVVVAGGEHGDIPLPAHGAAEIMRAAMKDGVSIIFDLYDINLSKGDWRRVVESAVKVLLYENKAHGLRHIFLEEAAEFCPQRVQPDQGAVYSAIERLARMGGNAQLGYTLINQRAEEVNKAVLELCDLLILHRQKGRNSLIALSKWLDVAMVKGKIAEEVPLLKNGECYIWPEGDAQPVKTKIPAKRTFHPDRKAMQKGVATEAKSADVSAFVTTMRASLEQLTKEAQANDPKLLRARIGELERAGDKVQVVDNRILDGTRAEGFEEGARQGYAGAVHALKPIAERLATLVTTVTQTVELLLQDISRVAGAPVPTVENRSPLTFEPFPPRVNHHDHVATKRKLPDSASANIGNGRLPKAERLILSALAQYPQGRSKVQVALLTRYAVNGGGFGNSVSALRTKGFVEGEAACLVITSAGLAALGTFDPLPTGPALLAHWYKELGKAERKTLQSLVEVYPHTLSKAQLANRAGYEADGGGWNNALSRLRTLELISGRQELKANDSLFGS